ncbi:MAG TPA: hypothetical protein P5048_05155 [Chlamydiales bacterium]|nr:hypothetical protein [Chlamydiales bacterium]
MPSLYMVSCNFSSSPSLRWYERYLSDAQSYLFSFFMPESVKVKWMERCIDRIHNCYEQMDLIAYKQMMRTQIVYLKRMHVQDALKTIYQYFISSDRNVFVVTELMIEMGLIEELLQEFTRISLDQHQKWILIEQILHTEKAYLIAKYCSHLSDFKDFSIDDVTLCLPEDVLMPETFEEMIFLLLLQTKNAHKVLPYFDQFSIGERLHEFIIDSFLQKSQFWNIPKYFYLFSGYPKAKQYQLALRLIKKGAIRDFYQNFKYFSLNFEEQQHVIEMAMESGNIELIENYEELPLEMHLDKLFKNLKSNWKVICEVVYPRIKELDSSEDLFVRLTLWLIKKERVHLSTLEFCRLLAEKKEEDLDFVLFLFEIILRNVFDCNSQSNTLFGDFYKNWDQYKEVYANLIQENSDFKLETASRKQLRKMFFFLKGIYFNLFDYHEIKQLDGFSHVFAAAFLNKVIDHHYIFQCLNLLSQEHKQSFWRYLKSFFIVKKDRYTSKEFAKILHEHIQQLIVLVDTSQLDEVFQRVEGVSQDSLSEDLFDLEDLITDRFSQMFEMDVDEMNRLLDGRLWTNFYDEIRRKLRGHDDALVVYHDTLVKNTTTNPLYKMSKKEQKKTLDAFQYFLRHLIIGDIDEIRRQDPHFVRMKQQGIQDNVIENYLNLSGISEPLEHPDFEPGCTLEVSTDWADMFLVGNETGSCMNYASFEACLIQALLGYVLNGKATLFLIRNSERKIVARRIGKLFHYKSPGFNKAVLVLEKTYVARGYDKEICSELITDFVKREASDKGFEVDKPFVRVGDKYFSYGGIAPCEYEDHHKKGVVPTEYDFSVEKDYR